MESSKVKMLQPWEMLVLGLPRPLDLRGRPRATCQASASSRLAQPPAHTKGSGRKRPGALAGGLRHLALGGTHSSMLPPVVGWKTLGDRSLWDLALLAAIASETFNVYLGIHFI